MISNELKIGDTSPSSHVPTLKEFFDFINSYNPWESKLDIEVKYKYAENSGKTYPSFLSWRWDSADFKYNDECITYSHTPNRNAHKIIGVKEVINDNHFIFLEEDGSELHIRVFLRTPFNPFTKAGEN